MSTPHSQRLGERLQRLRAVKARYDIKHGRIIITLNNGCVFSFLARMIEGLEAATDEQCLEIELVDQGVGLSLPLLNATVRIEDVMTGLFGSEAYMAALGDRIISRLKVETARANGAKGGRPRKTPKA